MNIRQQLKKMKAVLLDLLYKLQSREEPTPEKSDSLLKEWATAIKEFEGWYPNSRSYRNNNPGNLRYSKFQAGTEDNFSYFETYEEGWNGLLFQLRIAADGRSNIYSPDMMLFNVHYDPNQRKSASNRPGFFQVYAPGSDNNHPKTYAEFVARRIGVPVTARIKNLV
jgi:hypothetical protein